MEKTFWDRIEEATSGEYTRKMLASDSGVSVSTIGMWITRKSYPTADAIVRVAKALRTTVEYLVTGLEPPDDVMMASESPAQGYAAADENKKLLAELNMIDDPDIRALIVANIHAAADMARRKKNRHGGSAVS